MEIDNLIKKYNSEIAVLEIEKSKLNQETQAQYWLLLGKIESLGNCIVDTIEEFSKSNSLSCFQTNQLKIYKL